MEKKWYRIRQAGYFMGTYQAEGTKLQLFPRQAKYALLSGQLEEVAGEYSQAHAQPATPPVRKAATFPNPFRERSTGRSVGGGLGGTAKR
jgi:hypothetical protein